MAKLTAGTVKDLQINTLAGAMDAEFVSLWTSEKDTALPTDQRAIEDRRLMFVAIARGMLGYLHAHKSDIATTDVSIGIAGFAHNHQLEFEWECCDE